MRGAFGVFLITTSDSVYLGLVREPVQVALLLAGDRQAECVVIGARGAVYIQDFDAVSG